MINKKDEYVITFWETEEDRDNGISSIYDTYEDKEKTLSKAEEIYYNKNIASVEVTDKRNNALLTLCKEGKYINEVLQK